MISIDKQKIIYHGGFPNCGTLGKTQEYVACLTDPGEPDPDCTKISFAATFTRGKIERKIKQIKHMTVKTTHPTNFFHLVSAHTGFARADEEVPWDICRKFRGSLARLFCT